MARIFSSSNPMSERGKGFSSPSNIRAKFPGVTIANFLRAAVQARLPEGEELEATEYYAKLYEKMELLGMDRSFTSRSVNEGFSGGEKKRTRDSAACDARAEIRHSR